MDAAAEVRAQRVRRALDRMAQGRKPAPVPRAIFSAVIVFAFTAIARNKPVDIGGFTVSPILLAVLSFAVAFGITFPTFAGIGERSASGALGPPPSQNWKSILRHLLYPVAFGILLVCSELGVLDSTGTWLIATTVIALIFYIWFPAIFHSEPFGPPDPPRPSDDRRLAEPEAAALVAILDWDADIRADKAASALEMDSTELWKVLLPLHQEGIARAWDRKRRVLTELSDTPADLRTVWLGLTGTGRELLSTPQESAN